ncbi:MAG: aldolase/citrate lyase family protein, partial [Actinomycetota bacterium]
MARSYLYTPGDRPDRLDGALTSGADAVIADLEDGVAPSAKDDAVGHIATWLAAPSSGPARRARSSARRGPGSTRTKRAGP